MTDPNPDGTEPFVTAAQLSEYSKGQLSASDPRLEPAIAGASRAVRRYCGWHIFPEVTEELLLDGPGGYELDLPTLHVVDITSITNADSAVEATSYDWSRIGNVQLRSGWWSDRYRSIRVNLTHGFADAPDLVETVKAIVVRALSSPTGATREQAGQVSFTWAITSQGAAGGLAVLSNEYSILDSYRIVSA